MRRLILLLGPVPGPRLEPWIFFETAKELVGVAAFAGVVLLLTFLASVISGWRKLSGEHCATGPFLGGDVVSLRTAIVGWLPYVALGELGARKDGLHLALPLLAWTHQPLFLRWSDLRLRPHQMLGQRFVEIRSAKVADTAVQIRRRDLEECIRKNQLDESDLPWVAT